MNRGYQSLAIIAVALLACPFIGCNRGGSSGLPGGTRLNTETVRSMTDIYNGFMASHKNQAPKDEAEFRQYVASQQQRLEVAGLTVDQLFISPRKDAPLDWVYGRAPSNATPGLTILAYEREATDGQRLVLGTRGMFMMIDDVQFKRLFPNAP